MDKVLLILIATVGLLAGCGNHSQRGTGTFRESIPGVPVATDGGPRRYTLHAGDVLDIKFFHMPELNETLPIRPDGKISLQLVDEVDAAGLTPAELDALLTERYAASLENPELTVIVRTFTSQRVYVGGEVQTPAMLPLAADLTALQAIIQAGGLKSTAELSNIVIIRNRGTATPELISLNLKEASTPGGAPPQVPLQPGDIIMVPKSGIAQLNQFVDQYVDEVLPRALNFGFYYNLNPNLEVQD
ncbi:MAG: polysaccharide biosynthesis/export family protein [Sedimentisphaerales bacterium]|nr:polysaccharide biosynthesis/export family protein [Sedimentisphaerales bacterium]